MRSQASAVRPGPERRTSARSAGAVARSGSPVVTPAQDMLDRSARVTSQAALQRRLDASPRVLQQAARARGLAAQPEPQARASVEPTGRVAAPRVARAPRRGSVVQRVVYPDVDTLLTAALGGPGPDVTAFDPSLADLFAEAGEQLPLTDVVANANLPRAAVAVPTPLAAQPYRLEYNPGTADQNWLVSSMLHELIHVATATTYRFGGAAVPNPWLNLNLPPGLAGGALNTEIETQQDVLEENLDDLEHVLAGDNTLTVGMQNHLDERIDYSRAASFVHYDTVLADMMAYMELNNATGGPTFAFLRRMVRESTDRRRVDPWWGTKRARRVERNAAFYEFWKW